MQQKKSLSPKARIRSFINAFSGLTDMLMTEPNAWAHAAATAFVFILSWWLQIDQQRFALIVIAVVAVWVAEAFNTVLELMVDMVTSKQYSTLAKRAKDIAAAAVLIASLGAVLIGLVILGPPLYLRISSLGA
ncbi:MAG: diacylglycerol kinase family protein [Candidatus Omnitrophica bacterium]|nr:diacylglycerol kinase family protein [Candidatus Omnitrophota bacterium]